MADQQTVVSENPVNSAIVTNSANSELSGRINGKFAPGFSGNPLGRPKSRAISERLKLRLEEGKADELADNLVQMAEDKADKWLSLAATKEIVDRTEGKAMTRAIVGHTVDPNALARLNELADKLGL